MNEVKMNYREYNGLRGLAAVLSVLPYIGEGMQRRFKDMGQEYVDAYDRMMKDAEMLFDGVVQTVPRNRRAGIKQELLHTKLDIRTDYVGAEHLSNNWICVREDAFVRVAKAAQDIQCSMCMKRGREVKSCELRKMLDETLPYTCPKPADPNTCAYAEQLIETLEGKTVEEMMGEVRG